MAKDIKLDETGDLVIKNGDFVIADSDVQHVQDIINSGPGWWKQFPAIGVDIQKYIGSSGKLQELEKNIKLQLESDGYNVKSVKTEQLPDGTFKILGIDAVRR